MAGSSAVIGKTAGSGIGAAIGSAVLPGIGSAVGSALGGALSGLGGTGGDRSNLERHAIARRVRDAQEAGIHPLFALGSSVGYSPTFSTGTVAGDALRAGGEAIQRQFSAERAAISSAGKLSPIEQAQIRSLDASAARDEAQAIATLSEMRRATQKAISQGLDRALTLDPELFNVAPKPLVKVNPSEVTASEPGERARTAGVGPGMRRVWVGNGWMDIPDQTVVETPETVGLLMMLKHYWDNYQLERSIPKPPPPAIRKSGKRPWWDRNYSRRHYEGEGYIQR